ncbi:MAG: C39 family peptidase [Phycisphaerae bacterium]|nr:C39 family peptidase [Phycisphaerae bacterium]
MRPRVFGLVAAFCMFVPAVAQATVLSGVPAYYWYHGCSPTTAGMMVGYWDGLPGYQDLFDGDASVETQAVRDMISSPEHIADPYLPYDHPENCIADFMGTGASGITEYPNIPWGLEQYVEWDNPDTAINESYQAEVAVFQFWELSWNTYTGEIDSGRPVMLNILLWLGGSPYGHTVVGYGYQEDMFEISYVNGDEQVNLTVPGIAVRDTWGEEDPNGGSWMDWDRQVVRPILDEDGVEWWPWLKLGEYVPDAALGDWIVYQAVTLNIVPEPATVALLAIPFVALIGSRLRRRARQTVVVVDAKDTPSDRRRA